MNPPIRVFIVDDHAIVRSGITSLLNKNPDFELVGEAENGESAISKILEIVPDVVLLDISMMDIFGIEVMKKVKSHSFCNAIRFFMVTNYDFDEYYYRSLKAGALGVVSKSVSEAELIKGIYLVSKGQMYFGESLSVQDVLKIVADLDRINFSENDPENVHLTDRDIDILRLLLKGLKSKDIAEQLSISIRTVEVYRSNLFQKFNVATPNELGSFISSSQKLIQRINLKEKYL